MVNDSEARFVESSTFEDTLEHPVGANDFGAVVLAL